MRDVNHKGGSFNQSGLDGRLGEFWEGGKQYVYKEVIEPGIRSMLLKAGHGLIDIFFGGNGRRNYSSRYSYGRSRYDYEGEPSYYNYSSQSHGQRDRISDSRRSNPRSRTRYTKIIFTGGWADAEEAKDRLIEEFDRKHAVSVEKLLNVCEEFNIDGLPPRDHTDVDWGWLDISTLNVHSRGDGSAVMTLPPPEYIRE